MNRRLLKHTVSLLHVDYAALDNHWNYTNVLSPYYRIYLIDEGEGMITSSALKMPLLPGHLYMIPSFTVCNMNCSDHLGQYFIHFFEDSPSGMSLFQNHRIPFCVAASEFDEALVKRLLAINSGRGINRSDNPKVYEKDRYYKEYEDLNNRLSSGRYMETQGILLQLIARFLESDQFDKGISNSIPVKILEAISFIQLHLNEPLTVGQLASHANQHPDYFSRLFMQYTGERPLSYVHHKRIERAQYLITTTNIPFAEVASMVGFENLPHFSKIFKKTTNITPAKYRRQQQLTTSF